MFWDNLQDDPVVTGEIAQQAGNNDADARLFVRYTDVEGGLDPSQNSPLRVENLFNILPDFEDGASKDFRLKSDSPIVDTADPNLSIIPLDDLDLDGDNNFTELTPEQDLRRRDIDIDNDGGPSVVDLGAYENLYIGTCCANPVNSGMHHTVNVSDLLVLLAGWGDCPDPCQLSTCPADFSGDCFVNVTDLLVLIASWGDACSGQGICTFDPSALPDAVASTQFPSLMKFKGKYGAVSDTWSLAGDGRRLAADGFIPVVSSTITAVNWWGFYEQAGVDCAGTYTDGFTVTYFDAVSHPNTNKLVPGTVFASFTNLSLFIKIASGDTVENGITLYFYSLNHPAVNVTAGTAYFVEIRNTGGDTDADLGCHWRWPWSEDTTVLYSVEKKDGDTSYLNAGNPENKMSLAFGLNIEMDPIDPSP